MQNQPFTIVDLHAAYVNGARPIEVVSEAFRRVEAAGDPAIFIHLRDRDKAISAAERLGAYDPSKPLWGIPFAIKDNIDLEGAPTTAACPAFAYTAERNAKVVDLLEAAGAILIGKTNLDQFATGLVGVRSPYGIPRNALDPAIVPGGSSSGSAVATSLGIVAFALGTDTAGSGRIPAGLNNIVGLKPSLRLLSATGVVPACRTLDTVSVFAQTVDDAYTVLNQVAVYDSTDPYSKDLPIATAPWAPPHLTIGIPDDQSIEFFGDNVQASSFSASVDALCDLGYDIAPIDFGPFFAIARMLYEGAWVAERYTVIEDLLRDNPDGILPVIKTIIGLAETMSAADAFRGMYRLQALRREAEESLERIDLLCVPTMPTFYTVADLEADPIGPNARLGTYTNFVNLMNLCGIAVPTSPRSDGRPGSVTLLARAGQDGLAAGVARQLERSSDRNLGATDWALPLQKEERADVSRGEIAFAVCGAHMSGLPLNAAITERGGRFLRTAQTDACYRFYALAGDGPARPGLVRGAPDSGAPIGLEIWAMPAEAFGDFIKTIPSPLGIGTLGLADGSTILGFVCEAIAADDAVDITPHGDWRSYLAQTG